MTAKTIVIVTPTRNESRSAPLVIAELADAVEQLAATGWSTSLLVVDDDSDDDTPGVIRRECALRRLEVSIREGPGSGISRAITSGLAEAVASSPTLIATFDFDGQHDASQLPLLVRTWESSPGIDVVFGSRYSPGASVTGVRGFRRIISRLAQRGIALASVGPSIPTDSTTSLRIFTPNVAEEFLREVPSAGLDGYRLFSWFAVFVSCRFGYAEVPIDFRPRMNGVSKLRATDILSFGIGLRTLRGLSKDWMRQQHQSELFPEYPNEYLEELGELERYNDWILSTFAKSVRGRVADVGAGLGTVTQSLSALPTVSSIVAIEPDEIRFSQLLEVTSALPNVRCHHGTLKETHARFDTILYCNSLEHIAGLLDELRDAAEAAEPGATLIVFGPGMELIYGEVDLRSGHFRRFNLGQLSSFVEDAGFDVLEASYGDPVGAVLYGVSNRLMRNSSVRPALLPFYERVVLPVTRAATPLTKKMFGKNIVLVARRRS